MFRNTLPWICLGAFAVAASACTLNFDQFGSGGNEGTGASGAGGGNVTTSTTTSTMAQGGGGGTGGMTMQGGGGSGTGGVPNEGSCTDGADGDADGKTDCADEDCQPNYGCVDVPQNWNGPFVLHEGAFDASAGCSGAFGDEIYLGVKDVVGDDATCADCACGDPESASCELKALLSYASTDCGGGSQSNTQMNNMCGGLNGGPGSFKAAEPTPQVGPCPPSGGDATVPPHSWMNEGRVCGSPSLGTGCAANGEVCAPAGTVCVLQDGDKQCPNAYPNKHVFYDDPADVDDTRGCSDCQCNNPTADCTATTAIYSDGACGTKVDDVPNDNACKMVQNGSAYKPTVTLANAKCTPGGGQPDGTVTPADGGARTTVCCQ